MDNGDTQNFELDQFNLDTSSEDWSGASNTPNTPSTSEHNQRALGSTAIATPEADPNSAPQSESTPEVNPRFNPAMPPTPELGQVASAMPPDYEAPTPTDSPSSVSPAFSFQPHHAMAGDHLSPAAVSALQDRERKLSADGDIASFVDFISAAREQIQGKESA